MGVFDVDTFDSLDKQTKKILAETRESFIPHTPYQYEKNMLTAVRNGDLEQALKCIELLDNTGKGGFHSANPLRQAQIHLISHITLVTRAALEGGAAEDLAYSMSDSYIQISESCTSAKKVMQLRDRSIYDFTGLVRHAKNSPPYSSSTRAAVNYIRSHLQEKITLEQLAAVAGLSTSRFSHLFKEETGMSPMTFLLHERMETAEIMLLYAEDSVSEIGVILGFSSESHFIRTFKKYWGITPAKLRKSKK